MSYVAFLCGNCRRPIAFEGDLQGQSVNCGGCGSSLRPAGPLAELVVVAPAESAPNEEAETAAAPDVAGLVNLAALPVVEEKTIENEVNLSKSVTESEIALLSIPDRERAIRSTGSGSFPWLFLYMMISFTLLSGALNIYLVMRLRAADESLRKRACGGFILQEENRGRINNFVII